MIVSWQRRVKEGWQPYGRTETGQDYYHVRPTSADYSDYWGIKVDPDGQLRNRNTEEERQRYLEDVHEEVEFIRSLDPVAVLDVGAGFGWMLSVISALKKTAVEIAPQATRQLERQGITVCEHIADVPCNSQDVVIAYHVIEHMTDPIDTMRHIIRVLHRKAWLVLGTPDFGSPCAVRFGDRYRLLHDPTHCSLFTNESMTRMLRDHNFEIHRVRYPFPQRYATAETFMRWNDTGCISPPWPGNFVTYYATRS